MKPPSEMTSQMALRWSWAKYRVVTVGLGKRDAIGFQPFILTPLRSNHAQSSEQCSIYGARILVHDRQSASERTRTGIQKMDGSCWIGRCVRLSSGNFDDDFPHGAAAGHFIVRLENVFVRVHRVDAVLELACAVSQSLIRGTADQK